MAKLPIRSAVILWGAMLWLFPQVEARSEEPTPSIAVVVAGIGFDYVPSIVGTGCMRENCYLAEEEAGIRRELFFPSALKNLGMPCAEITADTADVEQSITVVYHCNSHSITERFTKVRPTSEASAILRSAGGWRLCNAGADLYRCGKTVRMQIGRQEWLWDGTIERWLSAPSLAR